MYRTRACLMALLLSLSAVGMAGMRAADLLTVDPFCGVPRLGLTGESGVSYTIESAPDLSGAVPWLPVLDLTLNDQPASWCDTHSQGVARRFYRALRLNAPPPEVRPRNFRLTDHAGKSHELYYGFSDETIAGYVLVFVGDSCSNAIAQLPSLRALYNQYSPQGVQFWMVSSLYGTSRSNLVTEAAALGIPFPVLHDGARLVTREFGVTEVPEAVVVQNWTFQVLYRGPVDEPTSGGNQAYVSDAVQAMLAQTMPTLTRVRVGGTPAGLPELPVPDYPTEVAPLLEQRCIRCHSPGNIASWSMTNHAVVKYLAEAIKDEILAQRMPPWHADPHVGRFSNDGSLRPDEAALLVRWVDAGCPRGTGPDPLETPAPPAVDWPLGQPDLILSIPVQSLPAKGDIDYRYLVVDTTLASDTWLSAAVVKPGNTRVVHHSLVFVGGLNASLGGLAGFFAGYVPGLDPTFFPAGTGKLLTKGSKLTFQMHYVSVGTPQTDQTQLGLYFLKSPPARTLQTKSAYDIFFQIPPRTNDYATTAITAPFTRTSWLYEISPHEHLRGNWFRYELQLANGTRTPIINIPHYLFSWQRLYRLEQPLQVPAGARIVCTGGWDNSPQNLSNPNPDALVQFGEQTYEEMFIGYYNYAEGP